MKDDLPKSEGIYYYTRLAGDAPFDAKAKSIVEKILLDNQALIINPDPAKHKDRIIDVGNLLRAKPRRRD